MLLKPSSSLLLGLLIIYATGVGATERVGATDSEVPNVTINGIAKGLILEVGQPKSETDPKPSPATPSTPRTPSEQADQVQGSPPKKVDEVARLKERIIELQNKGKLGFRKVLACSSVERFGVYSPLKPGVPISRLVLYFEPSNYSTLVTGERHIIDCTVDLLVFTSTGRLIAGKKGILKINRVSRSPILDLYYKIQVNLKKPPRGDIVIKTVLRDKIKNDSVSASYRINVKSGRKKILDGV